MGSRTFRYDEDGMHVVGAINVGTTEGAGQSSHVSSKQRVRIVQRDGVTVTSEEHESVAETIDGMRTTDEQRPDARTTSKQSNQGRRA